MKSIWSIDKLHSEVSFKVKHLMISNVKGVFEEYTGSFESQDNVPVANSIHLEIDVKSISTKSKDRDNHLRSADFFDVTQYPVIVFKGDTLDSDLGILSGMLTIKNVTLPVNLDVTHNGTATDPYGQFKIGYTVEGKLSRKSFGLTWNAATETGGVVVSDEVQIICEIQFIKQAK